MHSLWYTTPWFRPIVVAGHDRPLGSVALGAPKMYNKSNPFDWMELISLQGKTNFFEKRVGEYAKANVGKSGSERLFSMDDEF